MKQVYFTNKTISIFSNRHLDHFNTSINIFKSNILLGGGNKSFRFLCGKDIYTVSDDIVKRNIEYSQYSDTIILEKSFNYSSKNIKRDIFFIKYKNNNKYHQQEIINIKNLKDFF